MLSRGAFTLVLATLELMCSAIGSIADPSTSAAWRSSECNIELMTGFVTIQDHLGKELNSCRAELQKAQADMADSQRSSVDSQAQAAALQADLHATSAALADLTCTAQSCSLELQQVVSCSQARAVSTQPEGPTDGDGASDAYLACQAASAKVALQHACDIAVSAHKEAASQQLQADHQVMQSRASLQQASRAMQQFLLPTLRADLQPQAASDQEVIEQAVNTAAAVVAELVQQAVVASAGMASQLKASNGCAADLQASKDELQAIQASLRTELQDEQVRAVKLCACVALAQTPAPSISEAWSVLTRDMRLGRLHILIGAGAKVAFTPQGHGAQAVVCTDHLLPRLACWCRLACQTC